MKPNLTLTTLTTLSFLLAAASARAANVIVTNTNDALSGSLRQSILDANPNDSIIFAIPTTDPGYDAPARVFTINLMTGLSIGKDLNIIVAGSRVVVRSTGGTFSIFTILAKANVTIDNLTISNAVASYGGGVANYGRVDLTNCTLSGNQAELDGGGFFNAAPGADPVVATITNCTFTGNFAPTGGAIENRGSDLVVINCTISGNTGTFQAGGIENEAPLTTFVANSIVADNTGGNSIPDVYGDFISEGYNFIGVSGAQDTGFGNSGSHDQVGTLVTPAHPKLGSLRDIGGWTPTLAPLLDSPVIDQGRNSAAAAFDQRGLPRPIEQADIVNAVDGDGSDIGAVELGEFQTGPDFTVTTADDHDDAACGPEDCTLREALNAANQNADVNPISFTPGLGTITNLLAPDGFAITQPVTMIGPGARSLTISGANQNRVFNISGGPITIFGLTIANGSSASGGSGIANGGNLTLTDCTISDNHGVGDLSFGGGIFNLSSATVVALLTIDRCTFANNTVPTDSAGALYNLNGNVTITNSTFTGNSSPKAGAIVNAGFNATGTLTLSNCTITGNSATGASGKGGGVTSGNSSIVNVRNTIIARNTTPDLGTDVSGPFLSQGSNLIGDPVDSTGFIDGASFDQVGVADPKLGALGSHGGPTDTVALLPGSVAIDHANSATAPERDQRGYVRSGAADVGAFEFGGTIPATLANISTRVNVELGDNVLIGGFIVTGAEAKKVLVRAIGPSLALPGKLANPTLELYDASGLMASNDNWKATQQAEIEATTIPPTNDLESAIVATLPGNAAYTAIVRGANNGTGVGLVEVYDLDRTVDSKLANISSRALVQTGDGAIIGGFIVLGPDSQTVIVRGIGPSLPVAGKLANPTLELHDGNGALVTSNDDWRSDQEAEIIATAIPPTNDLESAIVMTLSPAAYTAIVSGANGTTGVALVEVYALK